MPDGNSIINLGDLAKPATVLIEKISNAVGVLYEPRRIRKKAEAEVAAEKIKAIANIELSDIQQRGIERLIHQEERRQENIEKITAQAIRDLPPNANTQAIEEDWIAHFFDRCEKISDREMQSLWSRLLAGEATNPGTYSKRTVDFVASMDKRDAELFTKLCQFTWMIAGPVPVVFDTNDDIYKNSKVSFSDLKHLDAIGLISFESSSGYKLMNQGKQSLLYYFGQPTLVEYPKDNGNELQLGQVIFTQAGRELVTVCGVQRNEEFYEYAIRKFSSQGVILSSVLTKKM